MRRLRSITDGRRLRFWIGLAAWESICIGGIYAARRWR